MPVILHGKCTKPTLIQRAEADQFSQMSPSLHVSHGEPEHEAGEIFVVLRPEHQVPMIGHKTVAQDSHRHALLSLNQQSLECGIIALPGEESHLAAAAIEDVINDPARHLSCASWHCIILPELCDGNK